MNYLIAFAGGGPATVHSIAEIAHLDAAHLPSSIVIIELSSRGPGGSAHSSTSSSFRVNMRTVLHDIPGYISFCDFLRIHGGLQSDPPLRSDLGRYVAHVAEEAERRLVAKGCPVRHLRDVATNITQVAGAYRIELAFGSPVVADVVVLATGNEAPSDEDTENSGLPHTSYDGGADFAQHILSSDTVRVKGTGPGGVDVARHLIEQLRILTPVHLTSRGGLLSAVQTVHPGGEDLQAEGNRVASRIVASGMRTLSQVAEETGSFLRRIDPGFDYERIVTSTNGPLAQLQEDIEAARNGGPRWRLALETLAVHAPAIWRVLDDAGKAAMFRHSAWLRLYYTKRHAMQMSTALWLEESLRKGLITVGSVTSPLPKHNRVVVATGPEYRVSKSRNPLLKNLLASGIAVPCEADGTEIGGFATANFQVRNAPRLFAMGALVRGEDFAVHSFPALALHARAIVEQLKGLGRG